MKSPFPYQAQLRTPFGMVGIHCADDALVGITFLEPHFSPQAPRDAFAREVCAQLMAYFDDVNLKFDLPVKLSGTEHQLKVWHALRDIPCGQVQTYGELAAALHSSPRAVGQACGNNPIPIVIPCHRVVSRAGLGGFMHRADSGALDIKQWLLAHEKVTMPEAVIDKTTSQSTKPASWQVAGYPAQAGIQAVKYSAKRTES